MFESHWQIARNGAAKRAVLFSPLHPLESARTWGQLRQAMIRERPQAFSRDEWAYLITFIDPDTLSQSVQDLFGEECKPDEPSPPGKLFRVRQPIAVCLPNNVSLLGPLALIQLSLAGPQLRIKAGSRSDDLTRHFVAFAIQKLPKSPLRDWLGHNVEIRQVDRADPWLAQIIAESKLRIVFGSNAAAQAIEGLPHSPDSIGFSFADRRSEAWVETAALDDTAVATLVQVFAIYGQAGCTSPRRVVVLGGTTSEIEALAHRLVAAWPRGAIEGQSMHLASECVMASQLAAAHGWKARLAPRHAAVVITSDPPCEPIESMLTLAVVARTEDQAVADLPANIQTIGHALTVETQRRLMRRIAETSVKRFVPIGKMHHFAPIWDGWEYFRAAFEPVRFDVGE